VDALFTRLSILVIHYQIIRLPILRESGSLLT
jgi:hypothetical protein